METPPRSRERATRQVWLNAAYDLFVSEGIEAVKIMALAKKLELTRTGFYWHFKDLDDLHAEIIQIWQTRNTGIMVQRCEMPADSLCAALFNLVDCWIDPDLFDAPLDLAIRNWARNDEKLQKLVENSDEMRVAAVQAVFQKFGVDPDMAHYRAKTAVLTQTGYYSMKITEPRLDRAVSGTRYVEIFAGERPTQQEIDDFLVRHCDDNS
ncbi:TetR/AcrR family transcriptional regulator [Roseobacter sp. EG26]|uniref:TetR/AcrR family transcriptional regulator n=1 Tax=Roseobacter sp. EG26 TaxID=3412477 RepID=UPI003CE50622